MKSFMLRTLGATAAFTLLLTAACKKDEVRVTATPSGAPTLTSSANNLTLLQNNSADNAATFTWTPVTFGFQSATVTYTLQFDKRGNNFAAPVSVDGGTGLTKTLTVKDLNDIYQSLNLVNTATGATQTATALDVRVVAAVGTTAAAQSPSSTFSLTATPYLFCGQPPAAQAWAIIGPAGVSWSQDVPMVYDCAARTYTYTGRLNADEFKFRYGGAWAANYGGASSTGGALTQDGPNLRIATAGTYTVVLTPGPIGSDGKAGPGSFTIR